MISHAARQVTPHKQNVILLFFTSFSLLFHFSEEATVAVSDSLGRITTVEVGESGPRCLDSWKAHQFEAWITALGHQSHLVFSGGDDSKLCVWDTRTGYKKPCFVSRRLVCWKCTQACRLNFLVFRAPCLRYPYLWVM